MRILNGFSKSFGSEFFAFVFGLSVDVFTLMFESRNSFCCLRKSLCIRDTRTLETWLNCF